ncbi:uncharacterized protein N7511_000834 [Penicillium nucicola]|uniref:uncharacterized protein n=1 Tax=Penicillium nucicola TaxID=1850975 RepID=UPI0025451DEC|nr:uncharacterized protein N7511_000834 [Penicillium nucicola]KAJ5775823.1 hypothetical protein N7511_000834 [Penicillium nucicola]
MSHRNEDKLGDPSLLDRIESLPPELIDSIIEASIFSEPNGSHEALHTMMELYQEQVRSIIKSRIEAVFQSRSLQNQIIANWKMLPDFSYDEPNRLKVEKDASYDLASWSIKKCSQCFQFLLRRNTIEAAYFCHTGESLYWIAYKDNNLEQGALIVASMSYENLLQPFLIDRLGEHSKSILQSSTWSEPWFRICWERVKSQPQGALSSLGPYEIGQICRFVDPGLAQTLLDQGLELGNANRSPWIHVVAQENPEAMFEWLWNKNYQPPGNILEYASTCCCTKAAGWLIGHTEYQDWSRALFIAAGNTEARSAELFEVLIHQEHFLSKSEVLVCDVLIKIVDEVCATSDQFHLVYREGMFPDWKEDENEFHVTILDLQKIAERKIRALNRVGSGVGLVGMKVKTRHAGLHQLTEALEKLNW